MLRFVLVLACLAAPVFSYSAGAPPAICDNGLTPEHHVEPQSSQPPYSFSGDGKLSSDGSISLTLGGDVFLGFAIQAQDDKGEPIGKFKIVESNKSQPLTCHGGQDNTLTHVKIDREHPINSVKFDWVPPQGYTGSVKFVATVAKDGGTYWIRKVNKQVTL